ncbi:Arv1-like protein [Zea mays]|uniref:Protein ARV n=2 Tax=Zea mays TaxID=4577 RepID=B4FMA7_MAIZE|nr:unknown [Zea mays]ONM09989.1 Arv1-like protein [Zea mays]
MSDAQATGDGPRCVGCGGRVKTLFVQYSPGNIRLMKCDKCKAVADPYIECEFMIILIDLVLHKTRAYRHVLFNKLSMGSSVDKGILYRSTLIHIALDTFRISFSKGNRAGGASSRSIFSTVSNCTEVVGDALLGNIVFIFMLLLGVRFFLKLSFDIIRYRDILFAVIISSYFKLFLFTMMVWEFPSSVIFIVEMFVLSSNVVALRVVSQFPRAHCFAVCLLAHAAKYLTQRWILGTP